MRRNSIFPAVDYNPFVKNSCRRDLALDEVFRSLNNRYFHGRLPRYQIFMCSKSKNFAHFDAGYCSPNDRKIFIRCGLSTNSTLQTLTHEMIHAKFPKARDPHGRAFIKELKRMRRLGAPLSNSELDLAQDFFKLAKLTKHNIRAATKDALITENLSRTSVPKFLEREFHLPYSRIRQVADVAEIIDKILVSERDELKLSKH